MHLRIKIRKNIVAQKIKRKIMRNTDTEIRDNLTKYQNSNWPCLFLWHIRHHHLAIHSPPTATMGALALLLVLSEAAAAADMDSTPVGPLTESGCGRVARAHTTPVARGCAALAHHPSAPCHESRQRTPFRSHECALTHCNQRWRGSSASCGKSRTEEFCISSFSTKWGLRSTRPPDASLRFRQIPER